MRKVIQTLLFFSPSFLNVFIRQLMGARIAKGVRIKFGTLLLCNKIDLGENVQIGPLCFVRAESLSIGANSTIKALSIVSTRVIEMAECTHIAPTAIINGTFSQNAKFTLGKHSRIFPFCWIDPGEGVFIGNNVGVGGHTLIFTHGSWPDYLEGGPVAFGPVIIEDNVWIPWRVFILPGVTIGANSIVGANSTVNKSVPPRTLVGGSPAKVLKENLETGLSKTEKAERLRQVVEDFAVDYCYKRHCQYEEKASVFIFPGFKIVLDEPAQCAANDLLFLTEMNFDLADLSAFIKNKISVIDHARQVFYTADNSHDDFVFYIRKFGIRLQKKVI